MFLSEIIFQKNVPQGHFLSGNHYLFSKLKEYEQYRT